MRIQFIEVARKKAEFLPHNLSTTLHFTVSQLNTKKINGSFLNNKLFYYANLQFKFSAFQSFCSKNDSTLKTTLHLLSEMSKDSFCYVNFKISLLKLETNDRQDVKCLPNATFSHKKRRVGLEVDLSEIDPKYIQNDSVTIEVKFYRDNCKPFTLDVQSFVEWHAAEQQSNRDQIMALKKQLETLDYYRGYEKIINVVKEGLSMLEREDCKTFGCQMQMDDKRLVHLELTPVETVKSDLVALRHERNILQNRIIELKKLLFLEKLK